MIICHELQIRIQDLQKVTTRKFTIFSYIEVKLAFAGSTDYLICSWWMSWHPDWLLSDPSDPDVWKNNTAHSVVGGIILFQFDCFHDDECTLFRNFLIYKAFEYGVYSAGRCRVEYDSMIIADTHVGILNMISGPDIRNHQVGNKPVTIDNCLFIGQSPGYSCEHASELDYESVVLKSGKSGKAECHGYFVDDGVPRCDGMSAIFMPSYTSIDIHPPLKKFALPKAQLGHGSRMRIRGRLHHGVHNKDIFLVLE